MSPETTYDPPTLEQARRHLAAQWEACLPRFRSVLTAFLCRGGNRVSREVVDDLLGEITQALLRKAMDYDPQRGLIAWAMGFARRIVANRQRRRRRRRQIPVSDLGDAAAYALLHGLIARGGDSSRQHRLCDWLDHLPESGRRLIELKYFQGLTAEELAAACGLVSAGAARVRLARALGRLRHVAEQDGGGAP